MCWEVKANIKKISCTVYISWFCRTRPRSASGISMSGGVDCFRPESTSLSEPGSQTLVINLKKIFENWFQPILKL